MQLQCIGVTHIPHNSARSGVFHEKKKNWGCHIYEIFRKKIALNERVNKDLAKQQEMKLEMDFLTLGYYSTLAGEKIHI